MRTTNLGQDSCPACGEKINAASSEGEAAINPGDLSLCLYCGVWSKYDDNIKLTSLTQDDMDSLDPVVLKQMDELIGKITSPKLRLN